jgi:hypothetical protein
VISVQILASYSESIVCVKEQLAVLTDTMFPTSNRTSVCGEAVVLLGREIESVPRTTDFAKRIWSRKAEDMQIGDSIGLR